MDHPPRATLDERWFQALFEDHFDDLWRFARRRCACADEADDVAAETFAVVWRRRDDLPPADAVRLWLFGTVRRVLANQRRAAGRQDRLGRRVEMIAPTLATAPDPADVVADRDAHFLLLALASLTENDRDLLIMRAWDGLEVSAIAVLLDVTPNAVSVRLTRARARLATALNRTDAAPAGQVADDPPTRKETPRDRP